MTAGILLLTVFVLAVFVQVDETRRYYVARCVNNTGSAQRIGRHTYDRAVTDTDVANRIQLAFWVNHSTAFDYDIVHTALPSTRNHTNRTQY